MCCVLVSFIYTATIVPYYTLSGNFFHNICNDVDGQVGDVHEILMFVLRIGNKEGEHSVSTHMATENVGCIADVDGAIEVVGKVETIGVPVLLTLLDGDVLDGFLGVAEDVHNNGVYHGVMFLLFV